MTKSLENNDFKKTTKYLVVNKRHWRGAPNNLLDVSICICLKFTALDSEGFSICRSIGYGHFNGSLKKDGSIQDLVDSFSDLPSTYSYLKLLTQK